MKRNNQQKRKSYQKFLHKHEKATAERLKHKKLKRAVKQATQELITGLQLEENIEINMDGPKKILNKRAHIVAMKKKDRKARKAPIPIYSMEG